MHIALELHDAVILLINKLFHQETCKMQKSGQNLITTEKYTALLKDAFGLRLFFKRL